MLTEARLKRKSRQQRPSTARKNFESRKEFRMAYTTPDEKNNFFYLALQPL